MTSYEPMISRAPGLQDSTADLAQKLSAAIQAGEMDEAANLATDLSRIRAKLDISVPQEDIEQRSKEKEFIVKVHLEDRVSAGCSFNLTVKACDTIGDLKRKVMLKHNFPMEVQRWIIGKKIHNDKDKLGQCGIKGPGNTVYLYLVTARSVGLTKQNYEASRQAAADDIRVQHSLHNPNVSPSLLPDLSGNPTLWPQGDLQLQLGSDLPLLGQAFSPVSSVMGELDQTSKQKMSISRGSSFIQEMLQSPMLSTSPLAQPVLPPEPQPQSSSPKPGKSRRSPTPNRGSITPPQSSVTQSNLPQSPGWECPACTYINLPTRPGCEMCSHNRPANYQIPANYQMTLQEREMLEKDQQLERMTREAVPPPGHYMNIHYPATPPQLADRARMAHEQLRDNLTYENIIAAGNQYIFVPGGSDWENAEEFTARFNDAQWLPQQPRISQQMSFPATTSSPPPPRQQRPRSAVAPSGSYRAAAHGGYVTQEPVQHLYPHEDDNDDDVDNNNNNNNNTLSDEEN